jgi:mycothiol system anti-sigma-R factor
MTEDNDDWGLDCREALHRVYHFLDGELTPDSRALIARHLDECAPCLRVFGFETEIRKLVAGKCREQVPDGLKERIAAAIDHESRLQ